MPNPEGTGDWPSIRDAYGPASDIPALLERMVPDQRDEVWNELWSRLCHQGSVYPASYAALPALESAARRWPATQRDAPLGLAAAIVASSDRLGVDGDPLQDLASTVASLRELALETLATRAGSTVDFIYRLIAVRALEGDREWAQRLDLVAGGELPGVCPNCDAELYLVIGQDGCFVTAEEWVQGDGGRRESIVPERGPLPAPGQWLLGQAVAAEQPEVAEAFVHLFGRSTCPACGDRFDILDAAARGGS